MKEIEKLAEEKYPEYPTEPKGERRYNRDVNCFIKRKAFIAGAKSPSMSEWVSVEDRMPTPSDYKKQTVLAVKSDQGYYSHKAMAWYGDNVGDGVLCFNVFDDRTSINKFKHTQVTHWMYIPE